MSLGRIQLLVSCTRLGHVVFQFCGHRITLVQCCRAWFSSHLHNPLLPSEPALPSYPVVVAQDMLCTAARWHVNQLTELRYIHRLSVVSPDNVIKPVQRSLSLPVMMSCQFYNLTTHWVEYCPLMSLSTTDNRNPAVRCGGSSPVKTRLQAHSWPCSTVFKALTWLCVTLAFGRNFAARAHKAQLAISSRRHVWTRRLYFLGMA